MRAQFGSAWCVGVYVPYEATLPDSLPRDSLSSLFLPPIFMEPLRLRWLRACSQRLCSVRLQLVRPRRSMAHQNRQLLPFRKTWLCRVLVLWAQASLPLPVPSLQPGTNMIPPEQEVPRQGAEGGVSRKWWLRVSGRHLPWPDGCFGGWRWPRPQALC